jgi:hypothetical protein
MAARPTAARAVAVRSAAVRGAVARSMAARLTAARAVAVRFAAVRVAAVRSTAGRSTAARDTAVRVAAARSLAARPTAACAVAVRYAAALFVLHALQRRALRRSRSGRMLYWRRPGLGLGLVSPSRALIREMSLVNVWYEGWMVGARPPLGGCIIASPPISFRSVASSRARTGSTSGALTRGMRFRAAGGLGRRARLCFAQEHCSCSQKNQGTFRQFHFVSEFTETASRAFGSHFQTASVTFAF